MLKKKSLQTLDHKNIIKLSQVIETPTNLAFVMQYCRGGEVASYLKQRPALSEKEARHFFTQLINAVHYLHGREIIHRDIKLKNMLIEEVYDDLMRMNTRLIDFGLANYGSDAKLQTFCGTPAYAAPEMILADSYPGGCVDVWSCGVALYVMTTGDYPFSSVGA